MSDHITTEMIHAHQRKVTLISAIRRHLDARIEQGKSLPDMTPEMLAKIEGKRDAYLAKAESQPDNFFAGLQDISAAMTALNNIKEG